jgi:hypothetical protein
MILMLNSFYSQAKPNDWTWSYRKKISSDNISINQNFTFSKIQIPHFNQLIFSWNSIRPKSGYFTFFVQARNSITKRWENWYKMADWGHKIQRSHCKMVDGETCYIYVRLELPFGKLADGFRLKIESHKKADLANLKMIGVCISNLYKFKPETICNEILRLPSTKISGILKKSQMKIDHVHNKRMCSPTSTSMLISYLTNKQIDPLDFALNSYDYGLEAYGSWPFNIAHAFEIFPERYFRVLRLKSFADLHNQISLGNPVVVSVRGRLFGAPQEYNSGHLILITGWDQKKKQIIVHDPAFEEDHKVEHRYGLLTFMRGWERSHRLAYISEKR